MISSYIVDSMILLTKIPSQVPGLELQHRNELMGLSHAVYAFRSSCSAAVHMNNRIRNITNYNKNIYK